MNFNIESALYEYLSSSNGDQAKLAHEFIEFLSEENCFSRNNLRAHFTAGAFVYDPRQEVALLIHHKKFDKWIQPGGHADEDRNLLRVAIKELQEETAVENVKLLGEIFDLDRHWVPEYKGVPGHYHYDVRFHFEGDSKILAPIANDEVKELKWVSFDELQKLKSDISVLALFKKARAYWRQP